MGRLSVALWSACCLAAWPAFARAAPDAARTAPPLALVGGKVIVRAGEAPLEGATVLVRDGHITAVGAGLELPFDARAVDVSGLTLTAAFFDALGECSLPRPERADVQGRPSDLTADVEVSIPEGYRRGLRPEFDAADALPQDVARDEERRAAGIGIVLIAPADELLSGAGALVALSGRPPREAVLQAGVASLCSLEWRSGPENYAGQDYPATLMGVMAHLRQALLDAQREVQLAAAHAHDEVPRRGVTDPALRALEPVLAGTQPLIVLAHEAEDIRLALGLAADFPGLRVVIAGGTEAWKLAPDLAARHVPVIHDLRFGKEPEDPDHPSAERAEDEADEEGEEGAEKDEGVQADEAEPAEDGEGPGLHPAWNPQLPERQRRDRHERWLANVRGIAMLQAAGVPVAFGTFGRSPEDLIESLRTVIDKGGLTADAALAALTRAPHTIFGERAPAGELVAGAAAHIAAFEGAPLDEHGRARVLVVDGVLFDLREAARRKEHARVKDGKARESGEEAAAGRSGGETAPGPPEAIAAPGAGREVATWPVELDSDRVPDVRTGGNVLVRGATILTVSHGTLEDSDLLVRDGKIAALGRGLVAPDGVRVIEAAGQFLMPGIIDCHCHAAIRGGINEWTRVVTPECTIEDEIDPEDVDLWRALAGGVTTARLLHGSSNAIGGRHEVIKLRWGKSAPELVFAGAPRGVKFALGENPRQSNGGDGTRFPRTRMGVEAVLRRALEAGREYADAWTAFRAAQAAGRAGDPPRRDLRLEALAGIVTGTIGIHSHCYEAGEILMLLRVAEDFGLRVKTLQHVLEGYKIAAEIAAHGAGASTFVDWWAYKFEVWDATPYNPAIMNEAGVLVSVNSDSDEHLRRLYLEAAKTCKYGGVPEDEALAMITLNPAKQLGIDARVGTLDVGKDADFALFSRHPFDVRTRCELTFIDGEAYFQRRADRYDAFERDVAARIEAGRAAASAAPPAPAPSALEARARHVDPAALAALRLPRDATRAPGTPVRPPGPAIALVGGIVHTMERDGDGLSVYDPGVVLMEGGVIRGVYAGAEPPPAGFTAIDVHGQHVWPGFVDAGASLGLVEIDSVQGTEDRSEIGTDQPDLRASAAYHADSEHIPVARVNGTTTALVVPSGERVAGLSAAMALEGWTAGEALVKDAVALHVVAPRTLREIVKPEDRGPAADHGGHETSGGHLDLCAGGPAAASDDEDAPDEEDESDRPLDERRAEHWAELRTLFADAREYARVAGESDRRGVPLEKRDARLEALGPFALGQAPVVFEADWADQIMDALDFAADNGLRPVIAGGQQAWMVADRLALEDVPVIVGPVLALPFQREDLYDAPLHDAAALHAAGVRICFRSNSSSSARDLPYHAGMAVAFGLPEEEALYALTAGAAEILGLQGSVGTLAPGQRGDVIVTDGSPLQIRSALTHLFIGGRDVGLATRHTRLAERYRGRLLDPARPSP